MTRMHPNEDTQVSASTFLSVDFVSFFLYTAVHAALSPTSVILISIMHDSLKEASSLHNLLLQHLNPPFLPQLLPQRRRQLFLHGRQNPLLADPAVQHHQDCNSAGDAVDPGQHTHLEYVAILGSLWISQGQAHPTNFAIADHPFGSPYSISVDARVSFRPSWCSMPNLCWRKT